MTKEHVVVRCLGSRVLDWEKVRGGGVLVHLKNSSLDKLIAVPGRAISFTGERARWRFIGSKKIVDENEMDEEHQILYRQLKGLECELVWKGVVLRKPQFEVSRVLLSARNRRILSSVPLTDQLANELNRDTAIMNLIRKNRLESLYVGLIPPCENESNIASVCAFYEKPTKIEWIILATQYMWSGIPYRKKVLDLCDLMELICNIAIKKGVLSGGDLSGAQFDG